MFLLLSFLFCIAITRSLLPHDVSIHTMSTPHALPTLVAYTDTHAKGNTFSQLEHIECLLHTSTPRSYNIYMGRCKPSYLTLYITFIVIANSNDIHQNPGPNESTIYPCGTCDKPVTWDHRAITCDTCDQWFHIDCQDVHSGTYNELIDCTGVRWDCIICGNPNYSLSCYGISNTDISNQFSVLSDTSIASPTQTSGLKPLHSSTPRSIS